MLRDREKNGSGLSPQNKLRWYKYLKPTFSETNEDIDLAAESAETSTVNDDNIKIKFVKRKN